MGENVICAVVNMLLPLTLLGLGLLIWLTKPGYGDAFGYRTTQSLRNKETWARAQELFGRSCTITFAVLSFITLISGVIPIICGADKYVMGIVVGAAVFVDFIAFLILVGVVDGIVKREFDADGNRKGGEPNE